MPKYADLPKEDGKVKYRGRLWEVDKPVKSDRPGKKMMVLARKGDEVRLIHFGASGFKHNYSESAKDNYLSRSAGIRDKDGNPTKDDKFSPNHWSRKILWSRSKPADGSAKTDSCKVNPVLHEYPIPQLRLSGHSDSYIQGYRAILQNL